MVDIPSGQVIVGMSSGYSMRVYQQTSPLPMPERNHLQCFSPSKT
jgi:hypothetical protein